MYQLQGYTRTSHISFFTFSLCLRDVDANDVHADMQDDDDIPSPEPVKKKKGGKGKKQMSKTSASAHPPEMMALNSDKGLVEVKDICRW